MITRIYADNFRCLSSFTFEPKAMNLIVGDNGAGKSALLEVISALRMIARLSDGLRLAFSGDTRTSWDKRTTQRFELSCTDADGAVFDWTVGLVFEQESGKTFVQRETVAKDGVTIAALERGAGVLKLRGTEVPLPYELEGSFLSLRMADADLRSLHAMIDNVVILKLDVLHIEDESSKPEGLRTDGTNFAAAYRRIRETDFERTAKLHEALKTVIGGFKSLDQVDVSSETTRLVVRLFMAKDGSTYPLRFKNLSDGQRALTVLYALTTTFDLKNRPLFIDEPDNFVSLRELQPWLQSLTQAVADEGAQATIVSHSPEVIDYLASDHAWLFERDDGGPSRVRPLSIDLDAGMKASEQLARGWVRGA